MEEECLLMEIYNLGISMIFSIPTRFTYNTSMFNSKPTKMHCKDKNKHDIGFRA